MDRLPKARSTSAGSTIIKAADLDAALEWGGKLARALTLDGRTSLPIEFGRSMREAEANRSNAGYSDLGDWTLFANRYGRAVAVLVRVFGDIDLAEEAVQDAFTVAIERWPSTGLPRARRVGSSRLPATARSTGCDVRHPVRTGTPRPL